MEKSIAKNTTKRQKLTEGVMRGIRLTDDFVEKEQKLMNKYGCMSSSELIRRLITDTYNREFPNAD